MSIQLSPHQIEASEKGFEIINKYNLVYLSMMTRTGKTLTALTIANKMNGIDDVLFLTKKNAIDSVIGDYKLSQYDFNLTVTNYEQSPKLNGSDYDLIILDESNEKIAAFPKMGKYAKAVQVICNNKPIIYLSATPSPESKSQLYHQFAMSSFSPFIKFRSFYAWAKVFVDVRKKIINSYPVNDYTKTHDDLIDPMINHLFVTLSQEDAGFTEVINDIVHKVTMNESTYKLIERIKKDKVVEGKAGVILADTPAKMMQTEHQISTGTIKLEGGDAVTIDTSKADYIKKTFTGKIAIFYNYIQEFEMLKECFPSWTNSDTEFNESEDLVYLGQFVSKRSGVSLKTADDLIFISVPFSATSYFQARSRHAHKHRRTDCNVHFILADKTIDSYIYKTVREKRNFTLKYYFDARKQGQSLFS